MPFHYATHKHHPESHFKKYGQTFAHRVLHWRIQGVNPAIAHPQSGLPMTTCPFPAGKEMHPLMGIGQFIVHFMLLSTLDY